MNYQKIYNQIIEKARREGRSKGGTTYYEAHHIIPKCLGGEGHETQWKHHSNIVLLTAKEHFVCHRLLVRLYPENIKLSYALWMMCNKVGGNTASRYTPTGREYQEIREAHSNVLKGKPAWNKGRPSSSRGKKQTQEHISKRAFALKGRQVTEETRQKQSQARKGRKPWNKGRARSEQENSRFKKAVIHTESGVIYNSFKEAAVAFKCTGQTIANRLKKGIFKLQE